MSVFNVCMKSVWETGIILTVYTCGFERASDLGEAPLNSVWCCTYANGGCGLIAKPLECTPGSQIQE